MNNCIVCNKELIKKRRGETGHFCEVCMPPSLGGRSQAPYWKVYAMRQKGDKCSICGYNKCSAALDFHHIDESTKLFSLVDIFRGATNGHRRTKDNIDRELDKCILICKNCHMELHYPH